MTDKYLPTAIFLMGTTASGKTALAIKLAKKLNAEIISIDSASVYKYMNIGTAKPTIEERQGIPHHLIDMLDPSEIFSVGSLRQLALQFMQDIVNRGKIPLLVGGSMLYFNALFRGLASLPEANPEIRKQLTAYLVANGKEAMYARLKTIDPEAAARIHFNDSQRIQRALEVYEISGKPISYFLRQPQSSFIPYKQIKLIVTPQYREQLHVIIAKRFELMLEQGFIEEVRTLYERGDLNVDLPAIKTVGYRQIWSFLQGKYDLETLIEKGIIATRQLAKRQTTWLRRETGALKYIAFSNKLAEKILLDICHAL